MATEETHEVLHGEPDLACQVAHADALGSVAPCYLARPRNGGMLGALRRGGMRGLGHVERQGCSGHCCEHRPPLRIIDGLHLAAKDDARLHRRGEWKTLRGSVKQPAQFAVEV